MPWRRSSARGLCGTDPSRQLGQRRGVGLPHLIASTAVHFSLSHDFAQKLVGSPLIIAFVHAIYLFLFVTDTAGVAIGR